MKDDVIIEEKLEKLILETKDEELIKVWEEFKLDTIKTIQKLAALVDKITNRI